MWVLTFQKLQLLKLHHKMQNDLAIICSILPFFLPLVFWLPPTANTSHIPEWSRTPVVIYKREWWLTRVVVEEKEMDAIFPRSHLCVFCPHIYRYTNVPMCSHLCALYPHMNQRSCTTPRRPHLAPPPAYASQLHMSQHLHLQQSKTISYNCRNHTIY